MSSTIGRDRQGFRDGELGTQAAEWVVRLEDKDADPEEPYPDPIQRGQAFLEWVTQSPQHLRVFMEAFEINHRLQGIGSGR